jgi:hypothetical protein
MGFTTTPILSQFRANLAARLYDPGMVHWTSVELTSLIQEALRTWNSGAFYHRERASITTVIGQPFYDLTATSSLTRTMGVQDACHAIQYSLVEHPTRDFDFPWTTFPWTGTEQFSYLDVINAIQHSRDTFLAQSGQIVSVPANIAIAPGTGRITLPDNFIDIRRVSLLANDGTYTPLWRVDEEMLNRRIVGWNKNAGTPQSYSAIVTPETAIQLAPTPIATGNLQVLVIQSGPDVDLVNNSLVGVFDDFVPAVLWGARAELLGRDGPARDDTRAQYCTQRFQEGIQLAKLQATSLQVFVNNDEVPVASMKRLDLMRPNWQSTTGTDVQMIGQESANLIALYQVPSSIYTVTVDLVRNALVPVADTDHIQLGDEFAGPLLDYCVHLAMFKEGGAEFMRTMPLFKSFVNAAMNYNNELRSIIRAFPILYEKSQSQRKERELQPVAMES